MGGGKKSNNTIPFPLDGKTFAVKEAEKGNREVNHKRTDDVLDANPAIVATGCPFCNTMMTDGVKNAERESSIDVKDIAELIAEAADLVPSN